MYQSLFLLLLAPAQLSSDPLPSWNDTATKKAIVEFVERTTTEGSTAFVPPSERIATFDNDGTLWSEQPIYFQVFFVMDRVQAMASDHPEWKDTEPFASAIEGDLAAVAGSGEKGLMQLLAATHSGMSMEEFSATVAEWIDTAKHPQTGRPFTEMVYQPMLELLDYLRAAGYRTYIVSGGGIEFMRPWTERVYGIPPEQVVGSSLQMKYAASGGEPAIMKLPEVDLIDDKEGKPVGIQRYIGRRPVMAFGNSDGDFQMLEWTTAGAGARFGMLVRHTDAEREWAYDRESHIGQLARGLDEAGERGWVVADMKADWKVIYPAASGE